MIAKLGETIEPSSRNKQHEYERKLKEKLEKLVASCQVPPWSNNQTNSGLESRYQHMVAVGKLHHNSIYVMSDIISQFKMLETSTKNILVKGSSLELMIIRAAFLKVCIFINYYEYINIDMFTGRFLSLNVTPYLVKAIFSPSIDHVNDIKSEKIWCEQRAGYD